MKILTYETENEADEKTTTILREIKYLTRKYEYLVPDGWRLILKMQIEGENEPYYHLDVRSKRGGGDYAEAKMATLESFPSYGATGGINMEQLLSMLEAKDLDHRTRICELISERSEVDQMTDEEWLFLRDNGIAPCYGGILIPYEDTIIEDDEIANEFGEIRIAFSGASQEQDLFFALGVFKALNDAFLTLYPNTQGWLNLHKLRQIPAVKFWLDLLDIREA